MTNNGDRQKFEEIREQIVKLFAETSDGEGIGKVLDAYSIIIQKNTIEDMINLLSLNRSIGMEFTAESLDETFKSLYDTYLQLGEEKISED